MEEFAESGLRTLVLAHRPLSPEEYSAWKVQFDIANSSMIDRQALKEACYTRMERSLILSGATAIEDRLQVTGGTSHASVLCRAKGAMHGVDHVVEGL